MATKIEWTDKTWNPVHGCTPIGPECENCYAKRMAKRLAAMGASGYSKSRPFAVTVHADKLDQPLHWRKPCMVFVSSMGDLFHSKVPAGVIRRIRNVLISCQEHTFQVLTKRPERMKEWSWPTNVWAGTTVGHFSGCWDRLTCVYGCRSLTG